VKFPANLWYCGSIPDVETRHQVILKGEVLGYAYTVSTSGDVAMSVEEWDRGQSIQASKDNNNRFQEEWD